jgi:flagellar motor switch protein FliN/FliY
MMQPSDSSASAPDLRELRTSPAASTAALDVLMDLSLPVVIEFGRTTMTVQELLQLSPGSVVQLDRLVGEPVEIIVGGHTLGEGEVVVVGENFGVRLTRLTERVSEGVRG